MMMIHVGLKGGIDRHILGDVLIGKSCKRVGEVPIVMGNGRVQRGLT